MLGRSRLFGVTVLLSAVIAGCGGGSDNEPNPGQDASSGNDTGVTNPGDDSSTGGNQDSSSGSSGSPDSSMTSGDDGSTPASDAGDAGTSDGATTDGGMPDSGGLTSDGGADGGTCSTNCDDGNPCTTDTCVAGTCKHDGTGVTTTGCMAADNCNTYKCHGDMAGTCDAVPKMSCASSKDACNAGVCDMATGNCKKQPVADGTLCEDGNACTTGDTCMTGTCKGGAALNCDDNNLCTTDTCDMTLGCRNVNNTVACNDGNPCTTGDVCGGGLCAGTAKDCSASADACNTGVCNATSGACMKSPKTNGTVCNDGKTCTTTDVCTGGTCGGSGNVCGPNSTACAEGTPVTCTCNTNYKNSGGQCVPDTDECDATPCVANATCNDPSSASGDVVCTCPAGYTGNGKKAPGNGCTLIDNCASNPCGSNGTCTNGVNTHTCTCNPGFTSVAGQCVCNMAGTFAQQLSLQTSWSNISLFEDGTKVPSTSWAIRTQTYDASGNLTIKTTQCGSSTVDLCSEGNPIGNEAYGQYLPASIFGLATMPVNTLTISLPNALQGKPYVEPQTAVLLGISLTDPLGAWPAAATNVGAGANQTNGAVWVDSDNDGFMGVTNYVVPPGGILHTAATAAPIQDFGANSVACPRRDATLAREAYEYLPGIEALTLERVKRTYTAQRIISSMSGTITSCDASGAEVISGTLGGPDSGFPEANGRVGGCVRVNGTGEIDCSSSLSSEYDGESQAQHVVNATFILKRVAAGTTCTAVRGMSF